MNTENKPADVQNAPEFQVEAANPEPATSNTTGKKPVPVQNVRMPRDLSATGGDQ